MGASLLKILEGERPLMVNNFLARTGGNNNQSH
jgi:hypothetical protein